MNQETAKRLRKIALGMVVAAEESGKTVQKVAYTQDRRTGQVRVAQATWKGVYKALKRAYKTGTLPKNATAPVPAAI